MAIDQRLMMGIIFIIAGVALALLAYAAFLYRKAPEEAGTELDLPEDVDQGEQTDLPPVEVETELKLEDSGEGGQEAVTDAAQELEPRASEDPELEMAEGPERAETFGEPGGAPPEDVAADLRPKDEAAATPPELDAEAAPAGPPPPITLSQNTETGRLDVQIGDRVFSTAEELRNSEQWRQAAPLLRDTVAWLTVAEAQADEGDEPADSPAPDSGYARPGSIVEQIDRILQEKLSRTDSVQRGVRLVEGAGGAIRVYVGVSSYSMEEVPDAEVRRIIREAVAEWEAQQ